MAGESGRINIVVELTPRANGIIDTAKSRLGGAKKELISRIIEGFAALEPDVQDLFLKPLDDPRRARIAAELLRSQAGEQAEAPGGILPAELEELSDLLAEKLAGRVADLLAKKGRKAQ